MVKIDGTLIQALPSSVENRQYVRGLIERAHHLGIVALAEWVDDEATARLLARWGLDGFEGAAAGPPAVDAAEAPLAAARRA
jgi:EAL domain-containing protein (putative c-di-GMP-specific phosphodiesterase class I)